MSEIMQAEMKIDAALAGLDLRETVPSLANFVRRVRSLGIRDHPTSPRSPWQNAYVERLIGSIRRECLDHVVVIGEQHLRHILMCYIKYYNAVRTHLSLGKDAPVRRLIQRAGRIEARPFLGGLHHQYIRI
jgi:transposase InsO family protein